MDGGVEGGDARGESLKVLDIVSVLEYNMSRSGKTDGAHRRTVPSNPNSGVLTKTPGTCIAALSCRTR